MSKNIICHRCGSDDFIEVSGKYRCSYCGCEEAIPGKNADKLRQADICRLKEKNFEKADQLYTEIIDNDPDEAAAYWGRLLCRYGIEIVETNGEKKPTWRRFNGDCVILDDADYHMALEKASPEMCAQYKKDAQEVDEQFRKIKHRLSYDDPYDVFISLKVSEEGDPDKKTIDCLAARELYRILTHNYNLRVFFSEESLNGEDEYEPVICAALITSPVMILISSCREHLESTWVKNEWSRFLCMKKDAEAYHQPAKYLTIFRKNMRVDELPAELIGNQVNDFDAIGMKEEVCEKIMKYVERHRRVGFSASSSGNNFNVVDMDAADKLCEQGFQQLRKKSFDKAKDNFEDAIKERRSCAKAYWGLLLISHLEISDNGLANQAYDLSSDCNFGKALSYATPEEKQLFQSVADSCMQNLKKKNRIINNNVEYREAVNQLAKKYEDNARKNRVPIDEETDGLFDYYWDKRYKIEQQKKKYETLARKTKTMGSFAKLFFIEMLLAVITYCTLIYIAKTGEQPAWALAIILVSMLLFGIIPIFKLLFKRCSLRITIPVSLVGGATLGAQIIAAPLNGVEELSDASVFFVLVVILFIISLLNLLMQKGRKLNKQKELRLMQEECNSLTNEIEDNWQNILSSSEKKIRTLNKKFQRKYGSETPELVQESTISDMLKSLLSPLVK